MPVTIETLKTLISEYVDVDRNAIIESANLRKDLGLNSFDLVSVATAIENVFGVQIPDSKIGSLKTVRDLLGFIEAAQ